VADRSIKAILATGEILIDVYDGRRRDARTVFRAAAGSVFQHGRSVTKTPAKSAIQCQKVPHFRPLGRSAVALACDGVAETADRASALGDRVQPREVARGTARAEMGHVSGAPLALPALENKALRPFPATPQ
jgi:hypothetical protein